MVFILHKTNLGLNSGTRFKLETPFGSGGNMSSDISSLISKSKHSKSEAAGIYSTKFMNPHLAKIARAKRPRNEFGPYIDPNLV